MPMEPLEDQPSMPMESRSSSSLPGLRRSSGRLDLDAVLKQIYNEGSEEESGVSTNEEVAQLADSCPGSEEDDSMDDDSQRTLVLGKKPRKKYKLVPGLRAKAYLASRKLERALCPFGSEAVDGKPAPSKRLRSLLTSPCKARGIDIVDALSPDAVPLQTSAPYQILAAVKICWKGYLTFQYIAFFAM